jgi:hypothetical protein
MTWLAVLWWKPVFSAPEISFGLSYLPGKSNLYLLLVYVLLFLVISLYRLDRTLFSGQPSRLVAFMGSSF